MTLSSFLYLLYIPLSSLTSISEQLLINLDITMSVQENMSFKKFQNTRTSVSQCPKVTNRISGRFYEMQKCSATKVSISHSTSNSNSEQEQSKIQNIFANDRTCEMRAIIHSKSTATVDWTWNCHAKSTVAKSLIKEHCKFILAVEGSKLAVMLKSISVAFIVVDSWADM